ncbi:MAG: glycerophosphodiester phosphodiesterase [Rhizobiales bacterium]|nr:glycerophosphodiester phosphodiesterase [Hyphomicrobiales bacterium]
MAGLDWLTARPIAHRGLHDATAGIIENTASAVTRAVAAQYGIEVDLQITADGEAVVFHDQTLDRLTGQQGRVDAMTADALMQVPLTQTSDRIIRLGDLCDLVAGRVTLLLELKSPRNGDRRLTQRVADVLLSYSGPVAAMSFDPDQVLGLRWAAPGLPRGITAGGWRRGERRQTFAASGKSHRARLWDALRMQPHFVAYAIQDLPAPLPLMARYLFGLPLLTWTVRSATDRARAAHWADQMIFEGFRP